MTGTPPLRYSTLALRALHLRRKPLWRRRLRTWAAGNITPLLVSERGEEHVRELVAALVTRLRVLLPFLDLGPGVLADRRFAQQFARILQPIAFADDVRLRGTTLRAYCDITASLAVFDALLREIAAELSCDEAEAALQLAGAASAWREPLVAAGRRLLAAGRIDDAAACARRALDIMSACPESQALLLAALRARKAAGGVLTAAEENGLGDLRGRFCPRPFEVIVSGQGVRWNDDKATTEQVMGTTYACDCAAWVPFVTGNMLEGESPDAVWNSPGMEEVRRSVLDGDFRYCSRTLCPLIATGALPRAEEVASPRLRRIIDNRETRLEDGPLLVALGHDSSCNLACPTCRTDLIMADRQQAEQLERGRDSVILPMLRNRDIGVHMTAWGDPFASRHYRSILEALRGREYDGVRLYLLTNGLGLTPQTWKAMPQLAEKIVELRVSVDAATKETYENVRRPGKWEVIRENLGAMGELSNAGTFLRNRFSGGAPARTTDFQVTRDKPVSFVLGFVVQSANFREMPAFVELGEAVGAEVVFQRYYSFGHEPGAVFAGKDVASPSHPEHDELRAILNDPIMRRPHVVPLFLNQMEDRSA